MEKGGACVRHALRMQARTSEKVGTVLTYHALGHSTHRQPAGSRVTVLGSPVHLCPVGPVIKRHHGWVAKSVVTGDMCTDRCFKTASRTGKRDQHRHLAAVLTSEKRQMLNWYQSQVPVVQERALFR